MALPVMEHPETEWNHTERDRKKLDLNTETERIFEEGTNT
jgi:hypothetical protein